MTFMDAGKTVAAGTRTWPDGATREIKIFTKDSVPDAPASAAIQAGSTQVGSLTVIITSEAAVSAGAMWNVDGGAWQNSGATVGSLQVGNHTVNFNTIAGWTSPGSQTVNIILNQTATTTGIYVQQTVAPISTTCGQASPQNGPGCYACCVPGGGCEGKCGYEYSINFQATACGGPGSSVTYGYTQNNLSSLASFPELNCGQWDTVGNTCVRGSGEPNCNTFYIYGTAWGDTTCGTDTISAWAEINDPAAGSSGQVSLYSGCCQGGYGGACPQ
jgi:hypothetical protein